MKDEGWKGPSALNFEETNAFWNIVSEPATYATVDDINAGDSIYLEYGAFRRIVIVVDKWTTDDGKRQVRFRRPHPGEQYEPPALTVLAEAK